MNYTELKDRIMAFSSNRSDLDDVPNLVEKMNISLTQVARDSSPMMLLKTNDSHRAIFKRFNHELYFCVPLKINKATMNIELDDDLLDALALHVLAGIETGRAPSYMKMYWNVIDMHERMIEDYYNAMNVDIIPDFVNGTNGTTMDRAEFEEMTGGS